MVDHPRGSLRSSRLAIHLGLGWTIGQAPGLAPEAFLGPIAGRTDETMRHLRAMLIYSNTDPRRPVDYPDYAWFQQDKGKGTPLKPTL